MTFEVLLVTFIYSIWGSSFYITTINIEKILIDQIYDFCGSISSFHLKCLRQPFLYYYYLAFEKHYNFINNSYL